MINREITLIISNQANCLTFFKKLFFLLIFKMTLSVWADNKKNGTPEAKNNLVNQFKPKENQMVKKPQNKSKIKTTKRPA